VNTLADIVYRGCKLNDSQIEASRVPGTGIGTGISGSMVDDWDFSDADVIQYMEKRSLQDGMDAGDVFIGARRLRMSGTLYDTTRALLFDRYWAFLAACNPVLAQRDSPADKGYCPLYFSVPTNDVVNYPAGVIPLRVLAIPRAKQIVWRRDQQGGVEGNALAIPWQVTFQQRDPNIYAQDPQDYDLSAGGTVSGNLVNRGTYITRPNMLVQVGPDAGSIAMTIAGVTVTITVPASSGVRIIRYKGIDKILTVEEGNIEVTRYDLLSLGTQIAHPIVPPGTSAYTVTFTGVTPQAGSHLWYWETYAG
jgi:hypothetical protein